jgi:hypothetical protein
MAKPCAALHRSHSIFRCEPFAHVRLHRRPSVRPAVGTSGHNYCVMSHRFGLGDDVFVDVTLAPTCEEFVVLSLKPILCAV